MPAPPAIRPPSSSAPSNGAAERILDRSDCLETKCWDPPSPKIEGHENEPKNWQTNTYTPERVITPPPSGSRQSRHYNLIGKFGIIFAMYHCPLFQLFIWWDSKFSHFIQNMHLLFKKFVHHVFNKFVLSPCSIY